MNSLLGCAACADASEGKRGGAARLVSAICELGPRARPSVRRWAVPNSNWLILLRGDIMGRSTRPSMLVHWAVCIGRLRLFVRSVLLF